MTTTRQECFSVSNQAEAAQRSAISASRQRQTLSVLFRVPLCGLSIKLVVARHLYWLAEILGRCNVNICFSACQRL